VPAADVVTPTSSSSNIERAPQRDACATPSRRSERAYARGPRVSGCVACTTAETRPEAVDLLVSDQRGASACHPEAAARDQRRRRRQSRRLFFAHLLRTGSPPGPWPRATFVGVADPAPHAEARRARAAADRGAKNEIVARARNLSARNRMKEAPCAAVSSPSEWFTEHRFHRQPARRSVLEAPKT